MATLEESIAIDISRLLKAGKTELEVAHWITHNIEPIREGLELRDEYLRKAGGRGL